MLRFSKIQVQVRQIKVQSWNVFSVYMCL